ncbi:MAG TPA: hypothetical protein DHW63_10535 [Hyphomonadaceae bacterium]|nr:hypothetical protein [Hyphomonadaceae bacterium]
MHVLHGERVRAGSPSAQIAAENATFWRTHAARDGQSEAELDAALSANLEAAREQAARMPGGGLMDIVLNTSMCQTLRADVQPGYDPVQQNSRR